MAIELPDHAMRVCISRKQGGLKEQHACAPHGRGASEPRQNYLGDNRLNLKQQECGQENSNGVKEGQVLDYSECLLRHVARYTAKLPNQWPPA